MKKPIGLLALAGLLCASTASAQTNAPETLDLPLSYDSGLVQNLQEGSGLQVVASFPVYATGGSSVRLFFSEVTLAGDPEAGTGSILRVTSMLDGQEQRLNAVHVDQWQKSTAYFNGDAVLVEVLAHPNTGSNRFAIDHVNVSVPPLVQESQCGSQDNRVPSSDPAAARLLPIGCTGWIIDDACGCMLTAGHCSSGTSTIQFNVPLSNSNGSLNNPSPDDQYSIDTTSRQSNGGQGIGNDYAYFGVFPNSNTGLTPREAQGAEFVVMNPPAFQNGQVIRITGYGVDSGTANQTQQTHTGPRVDTPLSTELEYQVDTEGGNSGSPVIFEADGSGIGIHTHAGCSTSNGNHGTAVSHPGLQAFLANPTGVCFKAACGVTGFTTFTNGGGTNPACMTSTSAPVTGQNWMIDVDASVDPGATSTFVTGRPNASSGTFNSGGEILIDLTSNNLFFVTASGGGVNSHTVAVPNNTAIVGQVVYVQGGTLVNGVLSLLCNAEEATIGCQ